MSEKYYTEEEIEEGLESDRLEWAGGVGGCGNMYLRESTFWTRNGSLIFFVVSVAFFALIVAAS